jgi:DNA-directed RNA polymerase subunit beta'
VLTEAAITGKVDRLFGLKENVIIGRLIPAQCQIKLPPPELQPAEMEQDELIGNEYEVPAGANPQGL